MIIMSIYISIILCYLFLICGIAILSGEISKNEREIRRMKTNLQIELDKLKVSCNNYKELESIYINADKNIYKEKRKIMVNLLRKITNDLYNLSDNHLVEYNDIEKIINLAKAGESIIKN